MKIAFVTLGCRTNQAESGQLSRMAIEKGHEVVSLTENADVCIINTCSVTAKADYQSRQAISRALKANCEVIVTGCYAELNSSAIKASRKGVKIIGNSSKDCIVNGLPINLLQSACDNAAQLRQRPSVKIQDGCNNSCSYCIIPSARGRSRSVGPQTVVRQVIDLENDGYEEIVLCGIHLGSYGQDLTIKHSLAKLLEEILVSTHKVRIRLSSLEINEITDHFIDVFHDERICRHLHIPLQSGEDEILALMNRPYTTKYFKEVLGKLCSAFDNLAIGTDVIVGFPAESSSHFSNIRAFIDDNPFTYLHVFPYSDRPGTVASTLKQKVDIREKKDRCNEIIALGRRKKDRFIRSNIGLEHDLLLETKTDEGWVGTTSNYIKALIDADQDIGARSLVRIRLTGAGSRLARGLRVISPQPSGK